MDARMRGIVFDLDGTLVDLDVDWDRVDREVRAACREQGIDPGEDDAWGLLARARTRGCLEEVETVIAEHEVPGAKLSDRLDLADHVENLPVPAAVCSLNCEEACRTALTVHGLEAHVDVVIGRDTVDTWKPDPAPLVAAVDGLGIDRPEAMFIGDSERDAITAHRADVPFISDQQAVTVLDL